MVTVIKTKELFLILSVLLAIILVYDSEVFADEIVLTNGDTLTGTITMIENGILTLSTEYSEPIKIQTSKIKSIFTDNPVEVHLSGGEVLKGTLKTVESGEIMVEPSGERESAVISWDKLKSVNPPPSKWEASVTVGANTQSGNTDRGSVSVGADAAKKTEQDHFRLHFLFNYAEENDEITARNTYGSSKYDYFFTKVLYGYLSIELLNDKLKDLNLRAIVGPGVGYQIWDGPQKSLQLEAGVSSFSEDLKEGQDDNWVTGRLSGDFSHKIKDTIVFSNQLITYPSLEDFGQYQLRNEAGLTTALGHSWALRLTNILERNSDPPPGVKKNDLSWLLGLQYSF